MIPNVVSDGRKSVRSFLRGAPSVRELLASRKSAFDRAHLVLPSTAVVGEAVELTVLAWDRHERLVPDCEETFSCAGTDPDAALPDAVAFDGDGGVQSATVSFSSPGIQYVSLERSDTGETFVSNPVRVTERPPEYGLYWGDLHFHTRLSDGVGSVAKGLDYGRDVMQLDVAAPTDHDTMGFFIPPALQLRRMRRRFFQRTREVVDDYDEPGEFVTLFGYEWTQQPNRGGHVNVYFESAESAELFSSRDAETDTYEGLWRRLREWRRETGDDVLTIPHHPAEGLYPFDFAATEYDDEMAPLVEVYSQWGSSEAPGGERNQLPIGGIGHGEIGEPGHYVQDALELGDRVGMMASSDIHGPYPGHSYIHTPPHLPRLSEFIEDGLGWGHIWRVWDEKSYPGGLVAFRARELSREAIFESLRSRSVYGTTQPARVLVSFAVEGLRLRDGESVVAVDDRTAERTVSVEVAGAAPLARVEVVKNNEVWRRYAGSSDDPDDFDAYTMAEEFVDDAPIAGMAWDDRRGTDDDAYYVRVRQTDGGTAWAGPIWASATDGE